MLTAFCYEELGCHDRITLKMTVAGREGSISAVTWLAIVDNFDGRCRRQQVVASTTQLEHGCHGCFAQKSAKWSISRHSDKSVLCAPTITDLVELAESDSNGYLSLAMYLAALKMRRQSA